MEELSGNFQVFARQDVGVPGRRTTFWLYWDVTPSGTGTFFIRCMATDEKAGERVALSGDLGSNVELALAVFRAVSGYPPVVPERLQQTAQILRREHEERARARAATHEVLPRAGYRHLHVVSQFHAASLLARLDPPGKN